MFQVKIGIRNMVMPGARMVMIVVMKFTAPRIVPKPARPRPKTQRLPPRPGVKVVLDSGAYAVQPNAAAPCGVKNPADGDDRAEQVEPVGERVQARERHVGRADLQRHRHVRESGEQRRREQQQHDRAVHREELVVLLVRTAGHRDRA